MSALTRIAYNDHPAVTVERGRHGDHLREARSRATSCACTTRSTGSRRSGAEVLHEDNARRARLRPRPRGGAAHDARARPAEARSCRCTASSACSRRTRSSRARPACPRSRSSSPRTARSSSSSRRARAIVDQVEAGVTFVDGLGVGDVARRRAARPAAPVRGRRADRRRDARQPERRGVDGAARADRARLRRGGRAAARGAARRRRSASSTSCSRDDVTEIKLLQEHLHDGARPARLRPDAAAADDPSRAWSRYERRSAARAGGWADVLAEHAARAGPRARLIGQLARLRGVGARVLPAARALGARRGGAADARAAPGGAAARGRAGRDRARGPRGAARRATCSSSSRSARRAARGTASPGAGELVDWEPVLRARGRARARRSASRRRTSSSPCSCARSRALRPRRAVERGARPLVALGRPVRPAREPARPRARGPARARRVGAAVFRRTSGTPASHLWSTRGDRLEAGDEHGGPAGKVLARLERMARRARPAALGSRGARLADRRRLGQPRPRRALRAAAAAGRDASPARRSRAIPGGKGANQAVAAARLGAG